MTETRNEVYRSLTMRPRSSSSHEPQSSIAERDACKAELAAALVWDDASNPAGDIAATWPMI
jgi:hypothetical protein